jgi:hypothetical protein
MKIPDRTREYAADEMNHALAALIPRASEEEIREFFEERLADMQESYQDFLSMPDV